MTDECQVVYDEVQFVPSENESPESGTEYGAQVVTLVAGSGGSDFGMFTRNQWKEFATNIIASGQWVDISWRKKTTANELARYACGERPSGIVKQ